MYKTRLIFLKIYLLLNRIPLFYPSKPFKNEKNTLFNLGIFAFLLAIQSCKKDSALVNKSTSETATSNSEYDATITDTSLLCYFPFNGNLRDKSGHNNNGTLAGIISYTTDRFGNALKAASFSVSNSYIEIPEAHFVGLTNMTISMDFFATSHGRQLLLSKITYGIPYTSSDFNSSLVLVIKQNSFNPIQFNTKKDGYCNSPI